MNPDQLASAYHECGHALAYWHHGVRVDRLHLARNNSGFCQPGGGAIEPDAMVVIALAGFAGEGLCGIRGGSPSAGDAATASEAFAELGVAATPRVQAQALRNARSIVGLHEREIGFLANELLTRGTLDANDLAELCRRPGSPLSAFAYLYPPSLSRPRPSRGLPVVGQPFTLADGRTGRVSRGPDGGFRLLVPAG